MTVAFFQVQLSVHPTEAGAAELVLPEVLQARNYHFVIIKDGGEEGIVKLEESDSALEEVENDNRCQKLTQEEMETLKNSYPSPKLKQNYREQIQPQDSSESETVGEPFAVDEQGNKIIDTWQTVRSGFYLIDVPILTPT